MFFMMMTLLGGLCSYHMVSTWQSVEYLRATTRLCYQAEWQRTLAESALMSAAAWYRSDVDLKKRLERDGFVREELMLPGVIGAEVRVERVLRSAKGVVVAQGRVVRLSGEELCSLERRLS